MKKFKAWLNKNNISNYKEETFGTDYFYNVKCPRCNTFHFCFELTENETLTRKALETIEKTKKYCSRYNYIVLNEQSIFSGTSYTFFHVVKKEDYEKYLDYIHFVKLSVNECEELRNKKGLYPGLNEDMKKIMFEYEQIYIDFLKALNQAA